MGAQRAALQRKASSLPSKHLPHVSFLYMTNWKWCTISISKKKQQKHTENMLKLVPSYPVSSTQIRTWIFVSLAGNISAAALKRALDKTSLRSPSLFTFSRVLIGISWSCSYSNALHNTTEKKSPISREFIHNVYWNIREKAKIPKPLNQVSLVLR